MKSKRMNRMRVVLAALCCVMALHGGAQSQKDSLALANADWNWVDLGKGAKAGHAIVPMFGGRQSVTVIKYPARKFSTSIIDAQSPRHAITPTVAGRCDALAAINASYFDMRKLIPTTYFAKDGKVVGNTASSELFRVNGYVALKDRKGHRMEIAYIDTTQYGAYPSKYKALLASGPVLLLERNIPGFPKERYFYDKRHPRTLIGYDRKHIYYVVIDGRFPEQGACGATIPEAACMARYLGMEYALNLDGGGSSTAWTWKTGVLNYPCDNKKFDHEGCRKVPNIIMMR